MAQVPNNYIIDGTGQSVLKQLREHYEANRSSFEGIYPPTTPALGQLWFDTGMNRLMFYGAAGWVIVPFNPDDGNSLGTSITDIPITSLRQMDIDLDLADVTDDPDGGGAGALVSAKGVQNYVDDETTAREAADTAHNIATDAHGVSGGFVGATGAQTLTDKILTSPEINGGTIDDATIGVTTPNSGKFTTLESTGAATLASAGVSGDLTVTGNTVLTGNLTVNGTETIINSTIQSHADKDIILAAGATTNAGVTNAGLLLGSPTTLESWLYDGANWAASAPVKAESFKVGDVTVIGTDGKVVLGQLATGVLPSGIKIGKSNWNPDTAELLGTRQGGTGLGAAAVPEGGLLLGGSFAAQEFNVIRLANKGEMLIGGTGTPPVVESGDTLRTSIGVGSGDSPRFTGINLGHASDTTISRVSAGNINIEGNIVYRAGGTTVPVADGGTGVVSIADESLLIGNSSGALVPATLGSGLDVDANNVISVDLSTLTDTIAPGGIPFNNYVITATVVGLTTTYDWSPFPSSAQSNLGLGTPSITQVDITNSDGTGVTLPRATLTTAGVMAMDDKTKLDGIEASADVTDTVNVVASLTAGTNVAIATNGTISSTDTTYSVGDGGLTQKNFTTNLDTKLSGIEASATADQAISMTVTGTGDAKVLNLIVDGATTSINVHDLLQGVTLFD